MTESWKGPWIVLRPGVIYGPGDRGLLSYFRLAAAGWIPLPAANARIQMIAADRAALAIARASGRADLSGRTVFLCDPEPVRLSDLAGAIAALPGRPARVMRVPDAAVRLLGLGETLLESILRRSRPFNADKAREILAGDWLCDGGFAGGGSGPASAPAPRRGFAGPLGLVSGRGLAYGREFVKFAKIPPAQPIGAYGGRPMSKLARVTRTETARSAPFFEKCYRYEDVVRVRQTGYYSFFREIESAQDPEVVIGGRRMIMLGSNNYLGLTNDARVKEAAIAAIRKYGSGCAGSRFLNGTLDLHVRLEERLAEFMRQESALTFSTGFQVNLGVISCLVTKGDTVYLDKQDHACIIDGARLSFGKIKKYKHNDPSDLRRQMRNDSEAKGRLVVIDGVFSMEGDIAPLPETLAVAREFAAGLMVDDAHGIGVLGATGRGTAEHFGLEQEVDLVMGTFSKSMASVGGFVAGDAKVIDFIKHRARTLIFSAAPPPASAAAALATLDIMDREPRAPGQPVGEHPVLRGGPAVDGSGHRRLALAGGPGRGRRGPDRAADGQAAGRGGRLRQLRSVAGDTAGPRADPHVADGDAHSGAAHPRARRVREGRPRGGPGPFGAGLRPGLRKRAR